MDIKKVVAYFWTWRKHHLWGWVEAVGLTMITLLFCQWVKPANPLFIKENFPWPWIAPIIVVFQYGFGPGLVSMSIIALAAIYMENIGIIVLDDFQGYLLSGLTLIFIFALFSSSWVKRMLMAEAINVYTDERLKSLSRSYYMLRVSSDYLEQNIITKPVTLRMALGKLQKLNINQQEPLSEELVSHFLQIISQICPINTFGVYLYVDQKINCSPFVEIGSMGKLILSDPLIKQSLELDDLCVAHVNQIEDASACHYLLAIPLISSENKRLGLLVIKEMPFWNLNEETIRVLSILVYYFSKEVVVDTHVKAFISHFPNCSPEFVKQLIKLIPLQQKIGINSAIAAVMIDTRLRSYNVIYHLQNQNRLLDSLWSFESGNHDVMVTLMPFTDAAGIHGFLTRIRSYLFNDLGLAAQKDKIKIRSMQLEGKDPFIFLQNFINFIEDK